MAKQEKVKLNKYEKWFRTIRRFEKTVFRCLFPYKKHGHTEAFTDGPYIFVGNHLGDLDVAYVASALNKPVHFLAKKELFEKGLMKWFVNKCQCIPVNRDGTDYKAIMQAMKYLKNGESIAIYPEGKRNFTDEIMLPFKSGAAAISIKTKTPIVPVVNLKRIKLFSHGHVLYGDPIEFTEYYDKRLTEEDVAKCDDELRQRMLDLYSQLSEMTKKKKK